MVLGEVEEHGDTRAKALDVLDLELDTSATTIAPGGAWPGTRAMGWPTLPATATWRPAPRQDGAGQLGGRRLAVRAGDADRRRVEEAIGELELAPRRAPARASAARTTRALVGHPRALHQQVDALGQPRPRAEVEDATPAERSSAGVAPLLLALGVERPSRRQAARGKRRGAS